MLRGEGQKIVHKLMNEVSTQSSNRRPDFYLKFLQVKFGKKSSWRVFFFQSMWLESPITFLHCVHEARMKKIVHLPPPSEKQIYIVQVADSGLYIETWLIWHYFQDWLSICQKSKLSNKKTFSSSPLSDKNGNPWHCGDNLLLGELWSQQNKPRGNETQTCFFSFFSKWKF